MSEETEIWKPVKDFEEYYLISNTGTVKSLVRKKVTVEKIRKLSIVTGYFHIVLSVNGTNTNKYIHRLVAESFVPNPNKYSEINHLDGNKLNNSYLNLEWTDRSGNMRHAYATGLSIPYDKTGKNNPKYRHGLKVIVNELKNCEWCSKEFNALYVTSKFCSHSCLVQSNLKLINEKRRYTI